MARWPDGSQAVLAWEATRDRTSTPDMRVTLLAQWVAGERDAFRAPEVRPGQIGAWLAGFCLYQWLAPVGPSSWIRLVDHTHPGQGAIGGSLPSFALSFLLSVALTLAGRATARRDRPSCA